MGYDIVTYTYTFLIALGSTNQVWLITASPTYSSIVSLAGTTLSGYVNSNAVTSRFNNPQDLEMMKDRRNLLVLDRGNKCIRIIDITSLQKIDSTLSGLPSSSTTQVNGEATIARFQDPQSMCIRGNLLFVTDVSAIRGIILHSGWVFTAAGTGVSGMVNYLDAKTARFGSLLPSIRLGNGILYISDSNNNMIRSFDYMANSVSTVVGGVSGYIDGSGISARFNTLLSLHVIENNSLIIAFDQTSTTVFRMRLVKIAAYTLCLPCPPLSVPSNSSTQCKCAHAIFDVSTGTCIPCAVGKYQSMYDTCVECAPGKYSNAEGATQCSSCPQDRYTNATGYGSLDPSLFQTSTYEELAGLQITGYAIMPGTDNVFVCTRSGFELTIYKADMKTFVTTLLYSTTLSYSSTNSDHPFNPIFLDNNVVTDSYTFLIALDETHQIWLITASPASPSIVSFAGSTVGHIDGVASIAKFYELTELAIASDGKTLFVLDKSSYCIRSINMTSSLINVTTLAGRGLLSSDRDSIGTNARFFDPMSICIHPNNLELFVTDEETIRRITISTGQVTTIAGSWKSPGKIDHSTDALSSRLGHVLLKSWQDIYTRCDGELPSYADYAR